MENTRSKSEFYDRCCALFVERLGYGRRWKTACAQTLGIGRATLYRYFEDDSGVPDDVLGKLAKLEQPTKPVRDDRAMIVIYATALCHIQQELDEKGWLPTPYPNSLRRALDLAAARNILEEKDVWPCDLLSLMRVAQQPLFRWVPDMSWDKDDEFFAARLVENSEITTACRKLCGPHGDPEQELEENDGFKLIQRLCHERDNGEEVYRAWRRTVIENPVMQSWSSTIFASPALASLERIDEVVEAFYQRVPEAMAIDGYLPICTISKTILRRDARGFATESRDPEAIRRARLGDHKKLRYRGNTLQLRRAFRTFWCLPGLAELELARALSERGWTCTLWPKMDRVDLIAVPPDKRRPIAVDVKDYISPVRLATRFNGFKEYTSSHDCFLVVPDHIVQIEPNFERRFETIRASQGKLNVALRTVSALLGELEHQGHQ